VIVLFIVLKFKLSTKHVHRTYASMGLRHRTPKKETG